MEAHHRYASLQRVLRCCLVAVAGLGALLDYASWCQEEVGPARLLAEAGGRSGGQVSGHLPDSSKHVGSSVNEQLRELAGLSTRMPYYVLAAMAVLKPIVILGVLGAPTQRTTFYKQAMFILPVFVPSLAAAVNDFRRARIIYMTVGPSIWTKINATMVVFGASSNVTTVLAISGVISMLQISIKWQMMHQRPPPSDPQDEGLEQWKTEIDEGSKKAGGLTPCESVFLLPLGCATMPGFFAFLIFLPAAIVYFYIVMPVVLILVGCVSGVCGMPVVGYTLAARKTCCAGQQSQRLNEEQGGAAYAPLDGAADAWKALGETGDYTENFEFYERTGYPKDAVVGYLAGPVVGACLVPFVVLAARLYAGCGYWTSVVETWEDRHYRTWVSYMLDSSTDAVGNVQGRLPVGQEVLVLAQRWLVLLNHLI